MATGACGIDCTTCRLHLRGECSSCGPALSETAQMKLLAQKRLLGAPCHLLACAREKRVNHCLADCDSFPCENFDRGPYPFSATFLAMQRRRREQVAGPEANGQGVKLTSQHWERLHECQPDKVAQAASVRWQGDLVKFQLLNRELVLSPSLEKVEEAEGATRREVSGLLALVALTYLVTARETGLTGRWVTEKDLRSASFFRGVHQLPLAPLLDRFGAAPELFLRAARKLGASSTRDGGDVSVLFWVLPKIPVKLILWCEDDELPAAITVLFDQSIEQFLPADGILAMMILLQEELLLAVAE